MPRNPERCYTVTFGDDDEEGAHMLLERFRSKRAVNKARSLTRPELKLHLTIWVTP